MQSNLAASEDNGKAIRSVEIAHNALEMKLAVVDIAKITGFTFGEQNICCEKMWTEEAVSLHPVFFSQITIFSRQYRQDGYFYL